MKKSFKFAAMIAAVALVMSGCITATVVLTEAANKEEEEILSGQVFEVEKATVTYHNNVILSFKQNGKFIRVEEPNKDKVTIIRPDSAFEINTRDKSYISSPNTNGKYYYSDQAYVYPDDWFDLHMFLGDVWTTEDENKSTTMDVAGRECKAYKSDRFEYAGYKRVFMYKKVGSTILISAISFDYSCIDDFAVPDGFQHWQGTVYCSRDFK